MKPRLALGAALLALGAAPEWPTPQPEGSPSLPQDLVRLVITQAALRCPLLNEWRLHVAEITYSTSRTSASTEDYHRTIYGWPVVLEVAFHLRDDTPIPPGLEDSGSVAGDVMFFDFGGGRRPGFIVNKPSARFACSLPVDSTDDVFIPDPWMSRLDHPARRP